MKEQNKVEMKHLKEQLFDLVSRMTDIANEENLSICVSVEHEVMQELGCEDSFNVVSGVSVYLSKRELF